MASKDKHEMTVRELWLKLTFAVLWIIKLFYCLWITAATIQRTFDVLLKVVPNNDPLVLAITLVVMLAGVSVFIQLWLGWGVMRSPQ